MYKVHIHADLQIIIYHSPFGVVSTLPMCHSFCLCKCEELDIFLI